MLNLPPMIPLSAWTSCASSPQRSKIRWYASRFASKLSSDAVLVAVERVGVLHDELAHAEEPAARPRLVPVLDREVVPELRQLLVRLDLARVEGDRLLVRERQDEVAAVPVREVEDLRDLDRGRSPPRARPASGPGISISWPPIASISSRMICSILRWTRQPSGRYVQIPALETWRMKPPRTSSLCDSASASEGASRSVGRNSCEARAIIVVAAGY